MSIFAQNNKISYQAVVRDAQNRLVANKTVTVEVSIFNGDAQTAAYTEAHTDVQTNFNGLISLTIGPGQPNSGWNTIQWNHARIETAVSLDGTQLAALEMPLTAVPYALYADFADDLNPNAEVVTNIYDKLGAKADTSKVYTRIIIDNKLDAKANTADLANVATTGSYNDLSDVPTNLVQDANYHHTDHNFKDADSVKLSGIASGAEVNVQADWNETNENSDAFIKNKPTIPAAQVNSDWIATSGVSVILNKPSITDSIRAYMDTCTAVIKNNNDLCTSIETCDNVALRYESNTFTQDNTFSGTISVPSNTTTFPTPSGKDYSNRADSSYAVNVRDLLAVFDSLNKTIESLKLMNDQLAERVAALESGSGDLTSCRLIRLDTIEHDFVAQDCDTLTGVLGANVKISIADGATVTLSNASINASGTWTTGDYAGLTCVGDATIILKDGTTNTVKGFDFTYPGVFVPSGSTLTIQGETAGTGELIARGNNDNDEGRWGAGIGGGYQINCGNIIIKGGTVTATGGRLAAGIGTGRDSNGGAITIESSVTRVTATKGVNPDNESVPFYSIGAGAYGACGTVTIGGNETGNISESTYTYQP